MEKNTSHLALWISLASVVLVLVVTSIFCIYFRTDIKLNRIDSKIDKADYFSATSSCDQLFGKFDELDGDQRKKLASCYQILYEKTQMHGSKQKFVSCVRKMYDCSDETMRSFLEESYPDEISKLRIDEASRKYLDGKVSKARELCGKVIPYSKNLEFEDMCDLTSLLYAIGNVLDDEKMKSLSSELFSITCNYDKEKAMRRYADNDSRFNITPPLGVSKPAPVTIQTVVVPSTIHSVRITGTNVRVRKGPGLQYDPITDIYGYNIHPDKGQLLEYLGEAPEFYRVRFMGYECWVSKQFSVPTSLYAN